jgi:hypothetical protein
MQASQRERVFDVVENPAVNSGSHPFREIAVELFGQEQVPQTAVLWVEQVHVLHAFVNHLVVFGLERRTAIGEQ